MTSFTRPFALFVASSTILLASSACRESASLVAKGADVQAPDASVTAPPAVEPTTSLSDTRQALRLQLRTAALAPLPAALPKTAWQPARETLPLIGEGVDDYGYPTRAVDAPKLRAMLAARNFNDLTANFEELQSFIETDFKSEMLLVGAVEAFSVADPAIPALVDEWVNAFPGSFAPYAVRCSLLRSQASDRRGTNVIKETRTIDLQEMSALHVRADADCRQALAQRPKATAVWTSRIAIAQHYGFDKPIAELGIEQCPHCFGVRSTYARTLVPRWGGSYEELATFVDESLKHLDKNPRLAVLRGFAAEDRCQWHAAKKEYLDALKECDQAIAVAPGYGAFHVQRGAARHALRDFAGALTDYETAYRLRPGDDRSLRGRARALLALERPDEALAACEEALRIDPFAVENGALLTDALVSAAHQRLNQGSIDDATVFYDRALQRDPTRADAREWKEKAQKRRGARDDLAPLQAAYDGEPDDIKHVARLDDAMAKLNRNAESLALWDRYLARKPTDATALYMRSGAYHRLNNVEARDRDLKTACELGNKKACRKLQELHD